MTSRASLFILSVLAGAALQASHAAAEMIGSTVKVAELVTAQFARDTRTLARGDDINQNEVIEVSRDGSGEFQLLDDTKLALGSGARLTLDRFVYDPDKAGNAITMRFLKGAFRFITGVAEKPAYIINVPAASITVRGTIFDVFVEDGGASWLLLHEGAVRVCNATGTCREHAEIGKLIKISDGGQLSKPSQWGSLPGIENISFDEAFPFVGNPPSLDSDPTLTREAVLRPNSGSVRTPPKIKAEKTKPVYVQEASISVPNVRPPIVKPGKGTQVVLGSIKPGKFDHYEPAEDYEDRIESYEDKLDDLKDKAESYKDKLGDYKDKLDGYKDKVGDLKDKVDGYKDKFDGYKDKLGDYKDKVGSYKDKLGDYKDKVGSYKDKLGDYKDKFGGYKDKLGDYKGKASGLKDKFGKYAGKGSGLKDKLGSYAGKGDGFKKKLGSHASKGKYAAQAFKKTGGGFMKKAGSAGLKGLKGGFGKLASYGR